MKGFRRNFICLNCGKKSHDAGHEVLESSKFGKVEYEPVDLCKKCFFEQLKTTRQNQMLMTLYQTGKISIPEMEKLVELGKTDKELQKKFRGILLRRNEMKKGDMKERKNIMIINLLKKSKGVTHG